uniref:F5/8 type C domain-containing protein n=1 Tax=Megaselia scalaris TaxID=36166 RepID=T1GP63_MEGSC
MQRGDESDKEEEDAAPRQQLITKLVPTTTLPPYIEKEENKPICDDPLGVENGQYPQNKFHSIWQHGNQKPKLIDLLKLSSPIGWQPSLNTPNEYIKFDFLGPRNLTGLTTKGGPHGWVTGYKVMYSKNGKIWNQLIDYLGKPRTLIGNYDNDSPQTHYFKYALQSRFLKIVPLKWTNNINMRVEPLGCFEDYPIVNEEIKIVEKPKPKPEIECAMCGDVESNELVDCDCLAPLYFNGTQCVEKNRCPCVDNHISYPIGSKYENKDCEECVCVLGGVSQCKPKKCPPCPSNQRHVITNSCYCKCESCPEMQKLCPSSGDCIPESFWCNGIKDVKMTSHQNALKFLNPRINQNVNKIPQF